MWSLKWYYPGICCSGESLTSSEMLFTFNKRSLLTINFKVCQGQAFLKHSAQPGVSRYHLTYVRIFNGFFSFLNPVYLYSFLIRKHLRMRLLEEEDLETVLHVSKSCTQQKYILKKKLVCTVSLKTTKQNQTKQKSKEGTLATQTNQTNKWWSDTELLERGFSSQYLS